MTYLIDGYNLMHSTGHATPKMVGPKFERARGEFLNWLAEKLGRRNVRVLVVFDAQNAVAPTAELDHRGVRVLYAYRETADDRIEALIDAEQRPAELIVVSDDARLRHAARRRPCPSKRCAEFISWLIEYQPAPTASDKAKPEKPDGCPPLEESAELLRVFTTKK